MNQKLYADRDCEEMVKHYTAHVSAMTVEGLHSKSAIAAELAFRDKRIEELEDALRLQILHTDTLADALGPLTEKLKAERKIDQYSDLRDMLDSGKPDEMSDEAWRQLTQVIPFRLREVMKGHLHSIDVLHQCLNVVADECLEGFGWSLAPWKSKGQCCVAVERKT